MKILITGCCGFIGFNLANQLLKKGFKIIGIDNINDYYDVRLKYQRLKILKQRKNFKFYKIDISDYKKIEQIFNRNKIETIINLATQAGEVRYSIENPKNIY